MPRQPEGKLVADTLRELRRCGGRWFKIVGTDNPHQEVGIPDILGCYKGRFYALEAKQPGSKPKPRQQRVIDDIITAGGVAVVFTTLEDALNAVYHRNTIADCKGDTTYSK